MEKVMEEGSKMKKTDTGKEPMQRCVEKRQQNSTEEMVTLCW